MLLWLELGLTLSGLYMIFTGKSWGKNTFQHWQLRLIGAFVTTVIPVVLAAGLVVAVVYGIMHPGVNSATIAQDLRWPITGMEFGIIVIYLVVGALWERALRRRVESRARADDAGDGSAEQCLCDAYIDRTTPEGPGADNP